jgi:protocatechuate 3,4-dioxygenase beta subunit
MTACTTGGDDPQLPETGGEPVQVATATGIESTLPAAFTATQPILEPTAPAETVEAATSATPEAAAQSSPGPVCAENVSVTPANMEGPYFIPNSPEKPSLLEPGMEGIRLVVTGYVLTPDCQPISGAKLDFWQADASGAYDNNGYRLRGHQFSADDGSYRLETILPADYGGRPRHIHVKVTAPGSAELTTQWYFAGEGRNQGEAAFLPELAIDLVETSEGMEGQFNFVLP